MSHPPLIFTAEYYRRLAALERTHPWFVGTRQVAGSVIPDFLGSPTGGLRILDVGCGTGATVDWLRRFAANRPVVGIDLAPAAVKLARRTGQPIALGSATDLAFADERFDLVYCADVVQHLDEHDLAKALVEFRRVLRPGGVAIVRSNIARGAPGLAGEGYQEFDVEQFPAEIVAAGLEPVVIGRMALISGIARLIRGRDAGGGWSSRGLAIQPLRGPSILLGVVLLVGFLLEALAFQLRHRLPHGLGASSLFVARKTIPFEKA